MTREEAIYELKNAAWLGTDHSRARTEEAVEMAIKALSQEPCDDAISRDMALEKMADYVASGYADSVEDFEEYSRIICQLPPVTHKSGKWIWSDEIGRYVCEQCGQSDGKDKEMVESGEYPLSNYCRNCGAKMESEE